MNKETLKSSDFKYVSKNTWSEEEIYDSDFNYFMCFFNDKDCWKTSLTSHKY